MTIVNKYPAYVPRMDFRSSFGLSGALTVGTLTFNRQGVDWHNEWERCLSLGQTSIHNYPSRAFTPGSVQGVWEGIFTVCSRKLFLNNI
jgi:hypothetical protein